MDKIEHELLEAALREMIKRLRNPDESGGISTDQLYEMIRDGMKKLGLTSVDMPDHLSKVDVFSRGEQIVKDLIKKGDLFKCL